MVLGFLKRHGLSLVALALGALGVGAALTAQDDNEQLRSDVDAKFDRYPDPESMRQTKAVASEFRDAFEQATSVEEYVEQAEVPTDADILVLTGDMAHSVVELRPDLNLGPINHETSLGSMFHVSGNRQQLHNIDARTEPVKETHHPLLGVGAAELAGETDLSVEDILADLEADEDDAPTIDIEDPDEGDKSALTDISGVDEDVAETLRAVGFTTKGHLRGASQEEIADIEGIGNALAARIKASLHDGDNE